MMELNTSHPLYSNLKFLFCVDENGELVDLVTPVREFTPHANSVIGSGAWGRHFGSRLSGSATAYNAVMDPAFSPANNTGTMVVVTNAVNSTGTVGAYCSFIGSGPSNAHYLPRISASGDGVKMYVRNSSSGNLQSSDVSTTELLDAAPHMWTAARDGTTAHYLYVDDALEASGAQIGTNTSGGNWTQIGGTTGQSGLSADIVWIAWFDVVLTAQQVADLYDSLGANNQFALVTSGTPTPIEFSGTVPAQNATVGVPFSLDLSTYFSGTETPFSYALQSGTLPDGLSLNASTGVISGTPTTPETQSGLAVRGTDQDANTDDTNSFSITVAAPTTVLGVRIQLFDGSTEQASLTGLTVAWFDDPDPATFSSPVYQSSTATTDSDGWLEVDLDEDTMLDIDDPGFLIVYKAGGTPEDDLVFAGRLQIEDIA